MPNPSADVDEPKLPNTDTVIEADARDDAAVASHVEPSTLHARRVMPLLDLLLISFLILFYELACIRFFGSMVVFLTFFTNIVLIACFLGMSIGCMIAGRRRNFIDSVLPLSFLAVSMALATFVAYQRY